MQDLSMPEQAKPSSQYSDDASSSQKKSFKYPVPLENFKALSTGIGLGEFRQVLRKEPSVLRPDSLTSKIQGASAQRASAQRASAQSASFQDFPPVQNPFIASISKTDHPSTTTQVTSSQVFSAVGDERASESRISASTSAIKKSKVFEKHHKPYIWYGWYRRLLTVFTFTTGRKHKKNKDSSVEAFDALSPGWHNPQDLTQDEEKTSQEKTSHRAVMTEESSTHLLKTPSRSMTRFLIHTLLCHLTDIIGCSLIFVGILYGMISLSLQGSESIENTASVLESFSSMGWGYIVAISYGLLLINYLLNWLLGLPKISDIIWRKKST